MGTTARRLCCPGVEVRRGWTARRAASAAARRIPHRPFRFLMPVRVWRGLFRFWLSVLAAQPDKRRAVRELLTSYDDVYRRLDQAAIAYDGGVHVKHRLTRYHDFFVERVRPGSACSTSAAARASSPTTSSFAPVRAWSGSTTTR